ncbi:MAG: XF1762 family protein [Alsobacter sp.]
MSLALCPITIREAVAFSMKHHRHHKGEPRCSRFAVAVESDGVIAGVAIVGNPCARLRLDDYTAEVTRLCVLEHHHSACSMLYAASWRAARALGYLRLGTYILSEESGVSLRAAGWRLVGEAGGGKWGRKMRPRVDGHPTQVKLRWEAV